MTAAWRANGLCRTPLCYDAVTPGKDYCAACQQVEDLARAELTRQLEESIEAARMRASHAERGKR